MNSKKKQAYEEALDKDSNLSDKLKEEIKQNNKDIEDTNNNLNTCNANIVDKETEVSNQEHTYSVESTKLQSLKDALSSLPAKSGKPEDAEKDAKIDAKKSEITNNINTQDKLVKDENSKLEKAKKELAELKVQKEKLEKDLETAKQKKTELDATVEKEADQKTKDALKAFNDATKNLEEIKNKELSTAQNEVNEAKKAVDEINEKIVVKEAAKAKSVGSLENARELYDSMGLGELNLNYEVFEMAIKGYNNLPEEKREKGLLGIFDTTQGDNAERYYLIDLNNHKVVGRSGMKTGTGNMGNVITANKLGSHATLSGFEEIGEEGYSPGMGKRYKVMKGLEKGINDNAQAKSTLVHFASGNHTWGCKGFTPVRRNGVVDVQATNEKMRELFPKGTIIFTSPTDKRYEELSDLV